MSRILQNGQRPADGGSLIGWLRLETGEITPIRRITALLGHLLGIDMRVPCTIGRQKRGADVETFWDWITVFTFAGLATLLLQRSAEEEPRDHLWQYAPPAIGCALANYVGNEGYHAPAAVIFVAVVVYIFKVLKVPIPFLKP